MARDSSRGASAEAENRMGTELKLEGACGAETVTPLGRFLAIKFKSPVKFLRVIVKVVAAMLPRGTGIICRVWESRLLNMGMEAVISGSSFSVSIR